MRRYRKSQFAVGLLPLLIFIAGMGCGAELPSGEAPDGQTAGAEHAEVPWHDGNLESALEEAQKLDHPVFIYIGAVWCPPCYYLKEKVFSRPEFLARIQNFVPLHLDADDEGVQIVLEKFDIRGYPTVILLRPDGTEILRMPPDIPVTEYAALLDRTLEATLAPEEILKAVIKDGPENASSEDLHLAAFYPWWEEKDPDLGGMSTLAALELLHRRTPGSRRLEWSRFLTGFIWIAATAEEEETEGADVIPEPDKREALVEQVTAVLGDQILRRANLSFVLYSPDDTVRWLTPKPGPTRDRLISAWESAAKALEDDEELVIDDRLGALFPQLTLAAIRANPAPEPESDAEMEEEDLPPSPPAALVERIQERIAWARQQATEEGDLQNILNTMAHLLHRSGQNEAAEALLDEVMQNTEAPYYFMSWVASLHREAGRNEEAVEWYRKAYEQAQGHYTRFRWGSTYLRSGMDLTPEDQETIETVSRQVLEELMGFDDAFSGSNFSRVEQLQKAYLEWNEKGDCTEILGRLARMVEPHCQEFPEGGEDSQRSRCTAFVNALAPTS